MAIRDLGLPPRDPQKPHLVPPRRRSLWKRVLFWTGIVVLVLVVAVAIGVYAVLHSGPAHNYVLKVAQKKISAALNSPVHVQNFTLHPASSTLDLWGSTITGTPPTPGEPVTSPLLQVQRIHLAVPIGMLLHGHVTANDITIDNPVVHLIINANGQTNLPNFQSSSSSNTNLFDLAIKHILVENGVVYINDQKNTLDADVHDLTFRSTYSRADDGQYYGTFSYNDGHLQYDSYAPIPHDLSAQFDAKRASLTLTNVKLTSGDSQLLLNASIENYSKPAVHAKYIAMLALGQFRTELRNPSIPSGVVLVNGTADYVSVPDKPALEDATLAGTIHSRLLRVNAANVTTDVRDLNASYSFANGNAEVRDFTARLLGGSVDANVVVRDVTGRQQGHAVAVLHGISLGDLKRIANSASLKSIGITGGLNASTEATWTGSLKDVIARADATASANIAPKSNNPAAVPVNAEVHARYNGRTQQIALTNTYVRMPQTSLELNGTVSRHSALQLKLQANDLHQLETIADAFGASGAQPLNLHGRLGFDGTVTGTTAAPQIAGQLLASNVQFRDATIRRLQTGVQASPSGVSLQHGDLELPQQQGHVAFNIQSGLHDWSHLPSSPFNVNLSATQVSLGTVAHMANVATPISGTLNANIAAHGTQLSPIGQGNVTLRNANVSGEPIPLAQVRFQGTGDEVRSNLLVEVSGGKATGQVTYYPKQQGYDGTLQALNINLAKLQILRERNLPMTGMLSFTASGRGTLKDPQGTASLTIPQLGVRGQTIQNISFRGDVADHEATFNLGSEIAKTPLNARGQVSLVGDYNADITVNTPVIPLQPILAAYAPSVTGQVSGQTEIHASLRGPLKNNAMLQAHLNVPTLAVSYKATTGTAASGAPPVTLQIAAVDPIRADYVNGVLTLQPGEIKGTDTDIRYQGSMPLESNAPSTLSVQGGINLQIAQLFDPTLSTGGRMVFDINAGGNRTSPNVEGQIRIVNASFSTPSAPLGLANGNGVLTLRRDRIDITSFTGDIGGGTVTASGGVTYRPAIHFDIGLKGNDLRVLYPQNVRTDFGANLAMTGTTSAAVLQGQINVNSVSFTQGFDLTSFINQFGGVATPPATQSFADNVKLNIAVRSTAELNVVSPTVSIQGGANLRVIGTASDPVILGRTDLTGGDVIFAGNRYVIQGGTIAFVNSIETEPVVNLQATTTIQQYNIAMRFRGPIDNLHTSYTSDPALGQADIIHLIAFGNTEEAANAAPAQSSTLGAESLIASQVSSQITSRVQKALGVSQISIDPQLGATAGNQQQGARLTVRQRVTSKMFVTFSTDVTTTQFSAVQLQYQLNRKWSLSGVRDENGGFSLDGRYHKEF